MIYAGGCAKRLPPVLIVRRPTPTTAWAVALLTRRQAAAGGDAVAASRRVFRGAGVPPAAGGEKARRGDLPNRWPLLDGTPFTARVAAALADALAALPSGRGRLRQALLLCLPGASAAPQRLTGTSSWPAAPAGVTVGARPRLAAARSPTRRRWRRAGSPGTPPRGFSCSCLTGEAGGPAARRPPFSSASPRRRAVSRDIGEWLASARIAPRAQLVRRRRVDASGAGRLVVTSAFPACLRCRGAARGHRARRHLLARFVAFDLLERGGSTGARVSLSGVAPLLRSCSPPCAISPPALT